MTKLWMKELMLPGGWKKIYREIRRHYPRGRRAKITREFSRWLEERLETLKTLFVDEVVDARSG